MRADFLDKYLVCSNMPFILSHCHVSDISDQYISISLSFTVSAFKFIQTFKKFLPDQLFMTGHLCSKFLILSPFYFAFLLFVTL